MRRSYVLSFFLLAVSVVLSNNARAFVPSSFGMGCHVDDTYPGHVIFLNGEKATEIYWDYELIVNHYNCSNVLCIYKGKGEDAGFVIIMEFSNKLDEVKINIPGFSANGVKLPATSSSYKITCAEQ
jgi:hypothetical protein